MDNLFSIIEIEINSNCNLACSYCPNADHNRIESGEMTKETFSVLMDQLKELKFEGIVSFHFYNEPLLCKQLNYFVGELKKELPKVRLQIYSNGMFLNFERTTELFSLGVDYFVITKHEKIQANFIFDKTYELLNESLKKRVIYKYFEDIELNNRGGLLPHLSQNKEKDYSMFPCMIAKMFTVITLKGNVLTCYEDFNQEQVMGNIRVDTLRNIWFSSKYIKFRKELAKKRIDSSYELCRNCNNFTVISSEW